MVAVVVTVLAVATIGVVRGDLPGWDRDCNVRGQPATTTPARGDRQMVVAAHPAAADVGCAVLAAGGTAADAAVATQLVLGVVEPHSSGLGGGSIATTYDADTGRVRVFDGLARSPAALDGELAEPTAGDRAALDVEDLGRDVGASSRAVGVPGTPALLGRLHDEAGVLPWRELFPTAIGLARGGSPTTPYLDDVLASSRAGLDRCEFPDLAPWCDGDDPVDPGSIVVQPELAQVLGVLQEDGAAAFYDPDGAIAPALVARLATGPPRLDDDLPPVLPGLLTLDDLADYRVEERAPRCAVVLGRRTCSAPAPSSGGLTVLAVLGLLERAQVAETEPGSVERVHLAIEASRLVQADRREFVGDPDRVVVPDAELLDPDYLDTRATLLDPERAVDVVEPGDPAGPAAPGVAPPAAQEGAENADTDVDTTTHLAVVDRDGNAVSLTSSVNSEFGAQVTARGIVLNDVLANFTATDSISRGERANPAAPSTRPRTTMAPTVVVDETGQVEVVVGAAGGSGIPDHVVQALLGMLVDDLDPAEALAAGHWSGQSVTGSCDDRIGARSEVEADSELVDLVDDLDELGHPCPSTARLRSGTTAILVDDDVLVGAADPRRDGAAVGG